jgi:hypothetical protein
MVDEKPEEYGVVITRVDSPFKDAATLRFTPYDPMTGQPKPVDIGSKETDPAAETDDSPDDGTTAAMLSDEEGASVTEVNPYGGVIHEHFALVPVDQPYQVFALKPGYYVIDHIYLGKEWQAKGGLHKVSLKPMYGGFEVKPGELLYLGDINLTTDREGYKNSNIIAQQTSPLGVLLGTIVYMSVPTFTNDDVALGIVDKTGEAKAYMKQTFPKLNRDMVHRPMELGYYAGQNHGE